MVCFYLHITTFVIAAAFVVLFAFYRCYIYIITAIFFMVFKKLSNIWWGIIIIVINILYLLWSRYYLDILIHMT
jgi:hypothetical protein